MIDWADVFDEVKPAPPACEADIQALALRLVQPPNPDEVAAIIENQINPFAVNDPQHALYRPLDPTDWQMPSAPLPSTYLELLRWSDGPWVRRGQREFGFFGCREIREYLFNYHMPYYLPGAVPLGLDGGGLFAVLDTRNGPADEYPVLAVAAGELDYANAKVLATSFPEFCMGTTSVADCLYPPAPESEDPSRAVALVLMKPLSSVKQISALHRAVCPESPITQFLGICRNAPTVLLESTSLWRSERILQEVPPEVAACLRIEEPALHTGSDGSRR